VRELIRTGAPPLEAFLTWWYGPPDRPAGPVARSEVPPPLSEWSAVTAAWSRPTRRQNQLLADGSDGLEDGRLVFWVENQGVWLWACDPDGDDPPVYDRENEPGRAWGSTGVRLRQFLVHVEVFEAVWSGAYGGSATWVPPADVAAILAPLSPVPGAEWRWPRPWTRLYAGDGCLALVGPADLDGEPATAYDVFVSGRTAGDLRYLEGVDEVDWEWASWRDRP
jgi:hypothetical protein